MVILQGDPGDNFYVVTAGRLAAYITAGGDEPIQEYRPGDTFGAFVWVRVRVRVRARVRVRVRVRGRVRVRVRVSGQG